MWQVFIPGLEVGLSKNISAGSTMRGIANGTNCTLAGLAFTDSVKHSQLQQQLQLTAPGSTLVLTDVPDLVLVNVGRIDDAPANLPLSEDGGLLMPLKASPSQQNDKNKAPLTVFLKRDNVGMLKHVNLMTFHYDLLFCRTFHKLQGMSLLRLLLDLSVPTYPPHHGFDSVLVASSRIGEGKYLRVLPGSDMGHLSRLVADPRIRAWMQGFPKTGGVWNRDLAMASLPPDLAGTSKRSAGRSRVNAGADAAMGGGAAAANSATRPSAAGGRGASTGRGRGGAGRGGIASSEAANGRLSAGADAAMGGGAAAANSATRPSAVGGRDAATGRGRGGAARGGRGRGEASSSAAAGGSSAQ